MRACRISTPVLSLLLLSLPVGLSAQRLSDQRVAFMRDTHTSSPALRLRLPQESTAPAAGDMVIAGLLTAGAFMAAGVFLGQQIDRGCDDEWVCVPAGTVLGGLLGEAIGVPLGVHLVGRRANLLAEVGTSLGLMFFAAPLTRATNGVSLLVLVPIQLAISVKMERLASTRAATPR